MLRDLSLRTGPLHEPLTPTEKELKRLVHLHYGKIESYVTQRLAPYGVTPEETREYLRIHLTRDFNAYIETVYPLQSPNLDQFVAFVITQAVQRINKQRQQQEEFTSKRYQRTIDPRGKMALPYPEIV